MSDLLRPRVFTRRRLLALGLVLALLLAAAEGWRHRFAHGAGAASHAHACAAFDAATLAAGLPTHAWALPAFPAAPARICFPRAGAPASPGNAPYQARAPPVHPS